MRSIYGKWALAVILAAGCGPAVEPAANPESTSAATGAGIISVPTDAADQPESAAPAESATETAASTVAALLGDPESQLVAAYKAAHANKDVEAMLKLYWFGDPFSGQADDEMRLTIRENVVAEMRCPLVDIKIEPADPGEHGPRVEGGVRWRPSLEVTAMVTANFDTSAKPVGGYYTERLRHGAGRRGGQCYFVVPIREAP